MRPTLSLLLLAAFSLCHFPCARADEPKPPVDQTAPTITVIDLAGQSHTITADDLAKLPRHSLRAKAHGVESQFDGVLLVDLLKSAGVEFGDALKRAKASQVAIVEATDGYHIPLTLLEIDPATTDRVVLLADHRDSQLLDAKEGPFRLVLPDDKRPIRWIRNIKTIRIVDLRENQK